MSVVLLMIVVHQFFRRANHRKREAGSIGQPSQTRLKGGVRNVPAIPTQEYIHFVDAGEGDVRGIAVRGGGEKPGRQNLSRQSLRFVGHLEQRNSLQKLQSE